MFELLWSHIDEEVCDVAQDYAVPGGAEIRSCIWAPASIEFEEVFGYRPRRLRKEAKP